MQWQGNAYNNGNGNGKGNDNGKGNGNMLSHPQTMQLAMDWWPMCPRMRTMPCLNKAKLIWGRDDSCFCFWRMSRPDLTVTGPQPSLSDVCWTAIRPLLREGRMITLIILPQKEEDSFRNCGSTSRDQCALQLVLLNVQHLVQCTV